ncbi:Z1 domain-containing protein [Amycolatopsis sp. NPDC059021]|uniref:Z1 domain-containing protein n=1 Tax=Amycolatopsis sp. NPDC059021 TaxID=3346704 RepID=UPI00366C3946
MRGYAGKQGRSPSSVTRYLNASNLPPEDFVDDLMHEVTQRHGPLNPGDTARLKDLYRAAQDAQPGGWGHTKRLKREATQAKARARAAELEMQAVAEEQRMTQRRLEQTLAILDEYRQVPPHGQPDRQLKPRQAERELQSIEDQRLRAELAASQLLLNSANERITELEHACASLRAHHAKTEPPPATVTDDAKWAPWYRPRQQEQPTYWHAYAQLLAAKGWSPAEITSADAATDQVVERLADPTASEAYQAKGMVLGYVQSGKAANITGLVAKAIDAGYRMVIVLSGPQNVLRHQLQQRLDEELPSLPGTGSIIRLTDQEMDYRRLADRLGTMEFWKRFPEAPFNDERNLQSTPTRLMVVKKNTAVLTKLVNDLQTVRMPLDEVPTLIIDADADADLSGGGSTRNRTTVGALVSKLLAILPRSQYVSYATSPIVDAFVDPDYAEDLFPRDFIVSLPRPQGYLGTREFHYLDTAASTTSGNFVPSRDRSHVRRVALDDADLREAMDMFVLTAAVKAFRESVGDGDFPRHTMCVQSSPRIDARTGVRARLDTLWGTGDYGGLGGRERLRALFEADVLPVSRACGGSHALPASFSQLLPSLDTALNRIGNHPVVTKAELDQEHPWKIFVIGNKTNYDIPSEGLTITYLRDTTFRFLRSPTLGHWFGIRTGYQDLVRLYVSAPTSATNGPDLYTTFVTLCHHEEILREELINRHGIITPAEIPPLLIKRLRDISKTLTAHKADLSSSDLMNPPAAGPASGRTHPESASGQFSA